MDVAQAFDKVWHEGLLHKLKKIMPHNFTALLQNYLIGRQFFVTYGSVKSSLHPIKAGVPQGSVLGPLLYTLFTSDLPEPDKAVVATFADDTAFLSSSPHYPEATTQLQSTIDRFIQWATDWKIAINNEKSVHVVYTLRPFGYNPVYINNKPIPYTTTAKYRGVHLDQRLAYKDHITNKRKALELRFQRLKWLLHPRSALTTSNKRLLYTSTLRPIWTYAAPIWGCVSKHLRTKIQTFQKKVLRMITGAPWYIRKYSHPHQW